MFLLFETPCSGWLPWPHPQGPSAYSAPHHSPTLSFRARAPQESLTHPDWFREQATAPTSTQHSSAASPLQRDRANLRAARRFQGRRRTSLTCSTARAGSDVFVTYSRSSGFLLWSSQAIPHQGGTFSSLGAYVGLFSQMAAEAGYLLGCLFLKGLENVMIPVGHVPSWNKLV